MIRIIKCLLTLTVATAATLAQADWTLSGSYITSGDWKLKFDTPAGLPANHIRITQVTTFGADGIADLSTPITDEEGTEYFIGALNGSLFRSKTALLEVNLPATLSEIPTYCFEGCTSLKTVRIPQNNVLSLIGTFAFSRDSLLESFPFTRCASLTNITSSAFKTCSALPGELPFASMPQLMELGSSAFESCSSLTGELALTNCMNLTFIGGSAFAYCTGIDRVAFPASLVTMNTKAFMGCSSVTNYLFNGYPTGIIAFWAQNIVNYSACVHVPETEGTGWLSDGPKSKLKLWADLTAAQQSAYTTRFGSDNLPYAMGKESSLGVVGNQWYFLDKVDAPKSVVLAVENSLDGGQGSYSLGTPTPAYGEYELAVGTNVEFSINRYSGDGYKLYEAHQGVLMKYNKDTSQYDVVCTNSGIIATNQLNEVATYKYIWHLRTVGYKPNVGMKVSASGYGVIGAVVETSTPDVTGGYYFTGNTATYVASSSNDAQFVRWMIGGSSNPIYRDGQTLEIEVGPTVSSRQYVGIHAYFKTPQLGVYNKRLSDGYNGASVTNNTDGVENALTILKSDSWVSVTNEFDLTLPIAGGYYVKRLGPYAYAKLSGMVKLVLPETLTTIDALAFGTNSVLRTIVFNSFPTIADEAFSGVGANKIEFCIPRNNAGWNAFLADSSKFTPWGSVSSELREAWKASHPGKRHPLGLTVDYNQQWVRYTVEKIANSVIILR